MTQPHNIRVIGGPNDGEWYPWTGERMFALFDHSLPSTPSGPVDDVPTISNAATRTDYFVRFYNTGYGNERHAYACPAQWSDRQAMAHLFGPPVPKGSML